MFNRIRRPLLGTLFMAMGCSSTASGPGFLPPDGGAGGSAPADGGTDAGASVLLPTGARITPTAAPGSTFQNLNPGLATLPDYVADHAVSSAVSPDGKTLIVLTSGYNINVDANGNTIAGQSSEYVFVYDISKGAPVQTQALTVPNTFDGIVWQQDGKAFYVAGGVDDNVHVFTKASGAAWAEAKSSPIALGHLLPADAGPSLSLGGLGLQILPAAAGVGVNAAGTTLVVANYENDSVSLVDVASSTVTEVELRPGKIDTTKAGTPGGAFPFEVVVLGNTKAYVSSQRDREVDVVDLTTKAVTTRISVGGQPGKMTFSKDQTTLYVVNSNSDTVSVIDTGKDTVTATIGTTAPAAVFANATSLKGSNPNGLALSPDGKTLYVTNGGTNSVAVIDVTKNQTVGLIPTGWYPSAVSVSPDGTSLFVSNGKSNPGPGCVHAVAAANGQYLPCYFTNEYVWNLEKAGLLTVPVPSAATLAQLTQQVALNNHFPGAESANDKTVMAFLHSNIKHVIYIIRENRTYDQVLGDLPVGNGDPSLAIFGAAVTPNLHALATAYVTLDAFRDSGETSGVGWNWTTSARTTDSVEKTQPINYAGRGLNYDWEGTNRNVNVGILAQKDRVTADPISPNDPDLLPGTADVAGADGPKGEPATGYLWDAAIRKSLSFRNYGCFGDLTRYTAGTKALGIYIPLLEMPFTTTTQVFFATKPTLIANSDPYFRGFDTAFPDYFREKEWEREFDAYVMGNNLPALEMVRLMHDHTGSFGSAIDGVTTPDLQVADNDYAVGLLIAKVAASPYKDSTLIFVIEDDAQDGADHVDAHRSVAMIVGPYVKTKTVVSTEYNTVSMVKTIEEVLGLDPLGLTDGLAAPMTDVFDITQSPAWTYQAVFPAMLSTTTVPPTKKPPTQPKAAREGERPTHPAAYWKAVTAGLDFSREDAIDSVKYNRILWKGMKGTPYPATRSGADLSQNREELLKAAEASHDGAASGPKPRPPAEAKRRVRGAR